MYIDGGRNHEPVGQTIIDQKQMGNCYFHSPFIVIHSFLIHTPDSGKKDSPGHTSLSVRGLIKPSSHKGKHHNIVTSPPREQRLKFKGMTTTVSLNKQKGIRHLLPNTLHIISLHTQKLQCKISTKLRICTWSFNIVNFINQEFDHKLSHTRPSYYESTTTNIWSFPPSIATLFLIEY